MKNGSTKWILILIATVLILSAAPVLAADKDAEYFPLTEGSTWRYGLLEANSFIEIKVTGKEKIGKHDCVIAKMFNQNGVTVQVDYFAVTPGGILSIGELDMDTDKKFIYKKPKAYLTFPIKKAKSWGFKTVDSEGKTALVTKRIAGVETVQVPAGKFEAVKVISKRKLIDKDPEVLELWYAKGVGVVKMVLKGGGQTLTMPLTDYRVK